MRSIRRYGGWRRLACSAWRKETSSCHEGMACSPIISPLFDRSLPFMRPALLLAVSGCPCLPRELFSRPFAVLSGLRCIGESAMPPPGLEVTAAEVQLKVAPEEACTDPARATDGSSIDGKDKVAVIGSGNWGSVAAKLLASNTRCLNLFHDEVRMWVFEELLPTGEKLSEVINKEKENVKYLPGIKLGSNVVAHPELESAVGDATMLVFVTPHQFIEGICKRLKGKIRQDAKAISLIKGMEVKKDGPCMISSMITELLGIDCAVLMGANIANEVAVEKFSEATVGYRHDKRTADKWVRLFGRPYFLVTPVQDVEGVELCGTLKNVVAVAAGLVDGLDMGNNTKAAIMRIGLKEMRFFSKLLFPSVRDTTFFESCGVADLITTCQMVPHICENAVGGRNRRVADAFARHGGKRSFDDLEAELLQGQKLQGVSTAREVYEVLKARNWEDSFPLFSTVHHIATGALPPAAIVEYSEHTPRQIAGTTVHYAS